MQQTIQFYVQNQDTVTPVDITFANDGLITCNSLTPYSITQTEEQFIQTMEVYQASLENRTLKGDIFEQAILLNNFNISNID